MSKAKLRVMGMDVSMNNWGIVIGDYVPNFFKTIYTTTIQPEIVQTKYKNTMHLHKAYTVADALEDIILEYEPDAYVVELPTGSQSASAMVSYGFCIGLLGGLSLYPLQIIMPKDNKKLVEQAGFDTSKKGVIEWANTTHPDFLDKRVGRAEHQADALATIYNSFEFLTQQYEELYNENHT